MMTSPRPSQGKNEKDNFNTLWREAQTLGKEISDLESKLKTVGFYSFLDKKYARRGKLGFGEYTQGSVVFADVDGTLIENNANLSWNNVSNTLNASNINLNNGDVSNIGVASFDLTSIVIPAEGEMNWSGDYETIQVGMTGGVQIPIGQKNIIRATNVSGTGTTNGRAFSIGGASNQPEASLANASDETIPLITLKSYKEHIPPSTNLANGRNMSGEYAAIITGPNGEDSAISFSGGVGSGLSQELTITKPFTVQFSLSDIISDPLNVFSYGGLVISISGNDLSITDGTTTQTFEVSLDDWPAFKIVFKSSETLIKTKDDSDIMASFDVSGTEAIVIDEGICSLYDFRVIKGIVSDDAFDYYLEDLQNNSGEVFNL